MKEKLLNITQGNRRKPNIIVLEVYITHVRIIEKIQRL